MDPLSIASGCAGLVSAIGSLSFSIHAFVRTCREARSDLDRVSRELLSLQTVLELIQEDVADDTTAFPQTLERHVSGIVLNCNLVVTEIQECITKYSSDNRLKVKASWAINGQGDIAKLRSSLEAHKAALELALDMFALHVTKDIKNDTTEIHKDTTAIKEDTAQILAEIARLQERLPKQVENDYILQHFLEEMTTYTEQTSDRPYSDGRSPSPTVLRPDFDLPGDVYLEDSERTVVSRTGTPWSRWLESGIPWSQWIESQQQMHGTSSVSEQGLQDTGPVIHKGPAPTDNHTPTSHRTDAKDSLHIPKSSINNPKLLKTVEDAIQRLILPELDALKRERNKREGRRDLSSSDTSVSKDKLATKRRRSGHRSETKERRNREARQVLEAKSNLGQDSMEDECKHENKPFTPKRNGGDALKAATKANGGRKTFASATTKARLAEEH
ncbi:hypothetical protein FAVG1_02836 [Fusarium avenaceum]|nr:hypothetical protein FAVG1_02836 [Fusarium avenaceum]